MTEPGGAAPSAPEPDAEVVATAALSCAGVHSLTRGSDVIEIATYLPGRRVYGVRVAPGRAEVHIVTEYDVNIVEVADRVRAAVRAAGSTDATAAPLQVDVYVDDVEGREPPESPAAGPRTPAGDVARDAP